MPSDHSPSSLSGRLQAADSPILRGVALAFFVGYFAFFWLASTSRLYNPDLAQDSLANDYLQEFIGGYIIRAGDRSRFYDQVYVQELEHDPQVVGFRWTPGGYLPMIYPPFYYLLVTPLALLPIRTGAAVWLVVLAAAWVGALSVLARRFPGRAVLVWAMPLGLLFLPMQETVASGQKGTVLLLILTGTYVLLDRGRPITAGLVFGLLTFKPHLALVIGLALLCKRQWRFAAGSVLTTGVFVGLCFVVGADVCRQYVVYVRSLTEYVNAPAYPLPRMHSWYGFLRLLLPAQDLTAVQALALTANGLTVALLAWLLRGPLAFGQPRFALQFAGLIVGTILLSPHLLTYDLVLLLLPLALIVLNPTGPGRIDPRIAWPALALYVLAGFSADVAAQTGVQISVVLMLALLAVLAWATPRESAPTALAAPQAEMAE